MDKPRAWAEVDLGAISHNLRVLRSLLKPATGVLFVVKADAYGHGAVTVARQAVRDGVEALGVGDSQEALELRAAGIEAPILILGSIVPGEVERVVEHDISVCVHSFDRIRILDREAARQGKTCRVHVMIDTGEGRLGVSPARAIALAQAAAGARHLLLEGVATHFSGTSPADRAWDVHQLRLFDQLRTEMIALALPRLVFHAANSRMLLMDASAHFDLVRPGIALYGMLPSSALPPGVAFKPVLSLRTQIVFLKDVPPGTPIGYGRLHVTTRKTRIATIAIGYNDGLDYRLSNQGHVLVRGQRAPMVGAVSMDYCMIDIGAIRGAKVGDAVTVIGGEGAEQITAADLAQQAGTIPYEISCTIGKRVRRTYARSERLASFLSATT
ncbi:MAG: alanine racemase [Planctomycetota bacterium]